MLLSFLFISCSNDEELNENSAPITLKASSGDFFGDRYFGKLREFFVLDVKLVEENFVDKYVYITFEMEGQKAVNPQEYPYAQVQYYSDYDNKTYIYNENKNANEDYRIPIQIDPNTGKSYIKINAAWIPNTAIGTNGYFDIRGLKNGYRSGYSSPSYDPNYVTAWGGGEYLPYNTWGYDYRIGPKIHGISNPNEGTAYVDYYVPSLSYSGDIHYYIVTKLDNVIAYRDFSHESYHTTDFPINGTKSYELTIEFTRINKTTKQAVGKTAIFKKSNFTQYPSGTSVTFTESDFQ